MAEVIETALIYVQIRAGQATELVGLDDFATNARRTTNPAFCVDRQAGRTSSPFERFAFVVAKVSAVHDNLASQLVIDGNP